MPPKNARFYGIGIRHKPHQKNAASIDYLKPKPQPTPKRWQLFVREKQLTYGELNHQANRVAHYLQSMAVGATSLVGLYLERSLDLVVALLGILKAGAAYVPLDLENPQQRQAFILEDAGISVLVTQASLLSTLPKSLDRTICLDLDRDLIARQPQTNCESEVSTSDLAHIVYTSGSTGKPKGVMLTHGNLSHYVHSLKLALEITPDDVYLHRGSIALIVSARQLLMPLAQGATAVMLTTAEKRDPLLMFDIIKRHGVTIVDHVPSFWRNFLGILERLDSEARKKLQDNRVRLVAAEENE